MWKVAIPDLAPTRVSCSTKYHQHVRGQDFRPSSFPASEDVEKKRRLALVPKDSLLEATSRVATPRLS